MTIVTVTPGKTFIGSQKKRRRRRGTQMGDGDGPGDGGGESISRRPSMLMKCFAVHVFAVYKIGRSHQLGSPVADWCHKSSSAAVLRITSSLHA